MPVERQKLVYKGRTLLDSNSIKEYNLEEDCKLNLLILKVTPTITSVPLLTQTRRSNTDQSNEATTSNDNNERNINGGKSEFQKLIELKLSAHFEPSIVKEIVLALNDEIKNDVNCSSLDDLERLAKQKLSIG